MKRMISIALTAMGLLAACELCAQDKGVQARIPFEFRVAGSVLPAGTYQVTPCSPYVMMIRSCDDNTTVLTTAMTNQEWNSKPSLIFHQYGREYFLREVRGSYALNGVTFPVSVREQSLRREQAQVVTSEHILMPDPK